jgi:quinone-modifying oxidoreductase subunit QmoC
MVWERLREREHPVANTFFDWAFLGMLLAVALSGLLSEGLHYARMEPHREIAYFIHLVLVFALLIYLPYSKLAHLAYRAAALVYAEYSGRTQRPRRTPEAAEAP